MQRLIRSFNTLTDELRDKLQEQYPDGIDNTHIRTIATAKGDSLRVIELRTTDAIYLIKISAESREEIEQFLDQDDGPAAGADEIEGGDELEGADAAEEEEDDTDAPDADDGDDEDEGGSKDDADEDDE